MLLMNRFASGLIGMKCVRQVIEEILDCFDIAVIFTKGVVQKVG